MTNWLWFGLSRGKLTTGWPQEKGMHGLEGVLGMPQLHPERCEPACVDCISACPSGAITGESGKSLAIDYGRCVVCQRCVEVCPTGALEKTTDWAFGVRKREALLVRAGKTGSHNAESSPPTHPPRGIRQSLHIRHVDAGSCNGCESELEALLNPFYNLHRLGIFFTASPRSADLLLVTGPVTMAMKEPLLETYQAMPEPRFVMATGTCATGGGIAGGGYACHRGLEGILPVDLWLPGCPPNPAAIMDALLVLLGRRPGRAMTGNGG